MSLIGDDCFFFYNTSCSKGPACPYRHVEEAKESDVSCPDWMQGKCGQISCPLRHGETPKNRQNIPCYYETQASGCTKPYCPFLHKFPKQGGPPAVQASMSQPIITGPPIGGAPGWPPNVQPPVMRGPPPHHGPPPNRMWPPPMNGPPPTNIPPGRYPVPVSQHPEFGVFHRPPPGSFPPMEPVIINLNSEESDQDSIKGSPMKSRTIVPPHQQTNKVDNPLDYFLNAKPWVDPSARYTRRSPSPPRYRHGEGTSPRQGNWSPRRSVSPRRSPSPRRAVSPRRSPSPRRAVSPRRSESPGPSRRRSISVDRGQVRRRSNSLDRSRSISPDLNRDRRRFNRRSPSPPRRRSRSPVRDRFGKEGGRGRPQGPRPDLRSRLKPPVSQAPKFEEIKLTGPKIVSLKKEKKEEEEEKPEADDTEDTSASKAPVVNEEIKSLEEIYRERALKSLMDAKRKRIMEQKRKRWETVKKTSESDKTEEDDKDVEKDGSDNDEKSEASDDEGKAETNKVEEDSSSDSPEEGDGSDIDLADDVDIEINAGELEDYVDQSDGKGDESSGVEEEEKKEKKVERRKREKVEKRPTIAKPSIKSRLGLKAVAEVTRQAEREHKDSLMQRVRSVKDRLGLRSNSPVRGGDRPLRSGVIKLNKARPTRDDDDDGGRVRITRNLGGIRDYEPRKSAVILPRITIQNRVDDRKNSIKQRLGLLDEEVKGKRKRKEIDEELAKLLQEEDVDIEESELDLLTKKEKKKLLKKLLTAQGREDDYDYIVKKKKRKLRRRERDSDEERLDEVKERRIKMKDRLGPSPVPDDEGSEEADDEELQFEEEIELAEDVEETDSPSKNIEENIEENKGQEKDPEPVIQVNKPVKSLEELRREKEARLKQELAPVSLDDIRKKRALKRIHAGGDTENMTDTGQGNRRIILDEPQEKMEKIEPPVKVTFKGDVGPKLRLSRIGEENTRPSSFNKSIKQERQIYMPPTAKKEVEKKLVVNPSGRDVVDYGDIFSKKSEPKEDVKKVSSFTPITVAQNTEVITARKPLRLNRGPPKVEVKDATVKTFAEIMAEKKRKRLLAQQSDGTAKKPYMPIAFEESETKPSVIENSSSTVRSRLSPIVNTVPDITEKKDSPLIITSIEQPSSLKLSSSEQSSMGVSSFKQSSVKSSPPSSVSSSLSIAVSSTDIPSAQTVHQEDSSSGVKGSRWKRRKTNTDSEPVTVTSVEQESVLSNITVSQTEEHPSHTIDEDLLLKSPEPTEEKPSFSRSQSSSSEKANRESPGEKKKKLSDSLLDSDDEFLMDDTDDLDLDLANTQDHDELMREIDELLA